MSTRPPLPLFSEQTVWQKVQAAEDAWNTRNAQVRCMFGPRPQSARQSQPRR